MNLEKLKISYGCDPEGFFSRNGHIIGSEKVIGHGLKVNPSDEKAIVVRDGVQFELNPAPKLSMLTLGDQITTAFRLIRDRIIMNGDKAVKCSWEGLVEVSRDELDSLSPECQVLGCQPSQNIYGPKPITVDAKLYRKRSAGGHLHLGFNHIEPLFEDRLATVVPLDILVGNTCVMIDLDPGMAERRENYGRAGEFRSNKPHGIEYRTLSNFWLRHYALMDLVFGMANLALSIVNLRVSHHDELEAEMADNVNIEDIIRAIDTNNQHLARKNFDKLVPFLRKNLPEGMFPISPSTIDKFLLFTDSVQKFGIELFFPDDPVTHWVEGKKTSFDQLMRAI